MKKFVKKMAAVTMAAALSVGCLCPVKTEAAAIKLSATKITLPMAVKKTLKVKGTKKKVKWKSSNEKVASVSAKGVVRTLKEGKTNITAKVGNKTLKCKVTVSGDYKKAYKRILEKTTLYYKEKVGKKVMKLSYTPRSFCLLDVDKNGVPELIIKDIEASYGMAYNDRFVYTMKNGKVVYCGTYFNRVGPDIEYSPKHKSFFISWWTNGVGGVGARLYRLKNGKLKAYQSVWEGDESPQSQKKVYRYIAGDKEMKKVSKKKYMAMVKKYFNEKRKSYSFTDNTEANRIRLLGK